MDKIIIGIAGKISSGKDTVADYITKKYNAKSLKYSQALRDVLTRIYQDISRDNMQKISSLIRQMFGEDTLAKIIYNDILNSTENIIVVTGVRRSADIDLLKTMSGFKLFYIDTNINIRYERLIQRSENIDDRNKTFEEFQKQELAEAEMYIDKLKEIADYTIDNNSNVDDLYKKVDSIISELKNS